MAEVSQRAGIPVAQLQNNVAYKTLVAQAAAKKVEALQHYDRSNTSARNATIQEQIVAEARKYANVVEQPPGLQQQLGRPDHQLAGIRRHRPPGQLLRRLRLFDGP